MGNNIPNIRVIYACGLVPLSGGLAIFLTWWGGKALYAINLDLLEPLGFGWMLLSFPVAIAGLVTGISNIYRFKRLYLKQTVFAMLVILLNIPVLNWVLYKQAEIAYRTYLKFTNNSDKDITITLFDSRSTKIVGNVSSYQSVIDYFRVTMLHGDDSAPVYDSVKMLVTTQQVTNTLELPHISPGECKMITLDKVLDLEYAR